MISKIIKYFKRHILFVGNFVSSKKEKIKLSNIIKNNKSKYIIIFENNLGYDTIMHQRPQHMAKSLGKQNVLFIYNSYDRSDFVGNSKIRKIVDNVYVMDLFFLRKFLIKCIRNTDMKKIFMTYSTNYVDQKIFDFYIKNNFDLLYEYVDDIDEKLCGKRNYPKLLMRHDYIINNPNSYIITTATKLYNNILQTNKNANVTLITNGVDYKHFSKRKSNKIPNDMKEILSKNKIIVGYYGAISSWFNYEIVKRLLNNEKYEVVIIGIDYEDNLKREGLLEYNNFTYLGKKEYSELPLYASFFDICIIPFIINDITISTSPVKVFEYMALGKPIVTTDLPECKKYKSVITSKTNEDFIRNVEKTENLINDDKYLKLLKDEATDNIWDKKAKELIQFITKRKK